ncbi:hypothetical protein OSTOST_01731, partial [Ostertagia ostertagi]
MQLSFKILNKTIQATEKTATWKIDRRPEKYFVVVVAKLGEYTGPNSTELVIDLKELAPDEPPTNLRADVFNPFEVYILFDPLPLSKIHGQDKGCK